MRLFLKGALDKMRAKYLFIFCFAALAGRALSNPVANCAEQTENYSTCVEEARQEFQDGIKSDDDRPDLYPRKACNYLTKYEECTEMMLGCHSEETMTQQKDEYIGNALTNTLSNLGEWDSDQCPVVAAYYERNGDDESEDGDAEGEENVEEEAGEEEAGADAEEAAEGDGEETAEKGGDEDAEGESSGDGKDEEGEGDDGEDGKDGEEGDEEEAAEDSADRTREIGLVLSLASVLAMAL